MRVHHNSEVLSLPSVCKICPVLQPSNSSRLYTKPTEMIMDYKKIWLSSFTSTAFTSLLCQMFSLLKREHPLEAENNQELLASELEDCINKK